MRISRLLPLTLVGVLVISLLGVVTFRTHAQTPAADGDDASEVGETDVDEANENDDAPVQGQATITAEEAKSVVLAEYPGAKIIEIELEMEGGHLVYSVEFADDTEVAVDANDGTLLSVGADNGQDD